MTRENNKEIVPRFIANEKPLISVGRREAANPTACPVLIEDKQDIDFVSLPLTYDEIQVKSSF